MGTNYYAFGPLKGTREARSGLHIGKKSAGWTFLFHAHQHLQLTSLEQWVGYLSRPGVEIADEYGSVIGLPEMISTMMRTHDPEGKLSDHEEFVNEPGNFRHNGFDFSTNYFC